MSGQTRSSNGSHTSKILHRAVITGALLRTVQRHVHGTAAVLVAGAIIQLVLVLRLLGALVQNLVAVQSFVAGIHTAILLGDGC